MGIAMYGCSKGKLCVVRLKVGVSRLVVGMAIWIWEWPELCADSDL